MAGQLSQALASFALQLLAVRALGPSGLGQFALILSVLLVTSAVGSGLVGDSLTVLDRHGDAVRSALQQWALLTAVVSGVTVAAAAAFTHLLNVAGCAFFGGAVAVFLIEDALRRLLMASMHFWSVVLVDLTALIAYVATLGLLAAIGNLSINSFLIALMAGQVAAAVVALPLLSNEERRLAPWAPSAMGAVAAFGFWRAAQLSIRPAMLTVARVLITVSVGRAAFGELEAARVYMAPAMLLVQGGSYYLVSSYARMKTTSMAEMLRRADRAAMVMVAGAALVGILATALTPVLGRYITGDSYALAPLAVFGWGIYAAFGAAIMPYASLAAVRGRQSMGVVSRFGDVVISLGCLWLLLFGLGVGASSAPYALAVGSLIGGRLIRRWVLKPLLKEGQS